MSARQNLMASALTLLLIGCLGCNEELGPINEPSGFRGVIRFKNWPPPDSLRDLRLVAFDAFPTDSAQILITLLAGGGRSLSVDRHKIPVVYR